MEERIQAYTVIELLVVFIISSIIITFSIVIIMNLGQLFEKGEKSINQQSELLSLKESLIKDLEKSNNKINIENNKLIIQSFHSTITYLFDDVRIIREIRGQNSRQYYELSHIQFNYEVIGSHLILHLESALGGNSDINLKYSSRAICTENDYLKTQESEH